MRELIRLILQLLRSLFASGVDDEDGPVVKSKPKSIDFQHYYAKDSLLSKSENSFYSALSLAAGDDLVIATKVRAEDVIGVKRKGRAFGSVQADRGRIKSRHFDFVVCNLGFRPLVIIEVDDASHSSDSAKVVDAFKDQVCSCTGLVMLRFPATPTPEASVIRSRLREAIKSRQ